jgi:hypothetical protein
MFPFGPPQSPREPGAMRHIAYVLATDSKPNPPMLLLAYTSSGPWRGSAPQSPFGVINFDTITAKALGQRPFHMDLRCLAQVPLTPRWCPDLDRPGHGIEGKAGARQRDRIDAMLSDLLARHRDLIDVRGPGR